MADRTGGTRGPVAAGWHADPMRRAALRYWGPGWTEWVSDGHEVWADPAPVRRGLGPHDLASIDFVTEVLLPEARSRGLLEEGAEPGLRALVEDLTAEARSLARPWSAAQPSPSAAYQPSPSAPYRPTSPAAHGPAAAGPGGPLAGAVAPRTGAVLGGPVAADITPDAAPTPTPGRLRRWWDGARTAVGADLGVHGLAYLGVLLLFVGVFGLVAFAFADVAPAMRPVAEAAAAVVPFAAAGLLLRSGATVVARALETVGGLLLPIMVLTSMVDGYPVPPDPRGTPLVVALTLSTLTVAAGYVVWVRRHPSSGLRYAVAPTVWLAAAMATLGVGRAMPSGQDIAVPSSAQAAAMSVALVVTLLVARAVTGGRGQWYSRATFTTARSGLVVLGVLTVLTWAAEAWPSTEILLAGVLLLVALQLTRGRLPAVVVDVAGPVWWSAVLLALLQGVAAAAVGVLGLLGHLVLLEAAGRRGRGGWALLLPSAGIALSVLALWTEPVWATAGLAALAVWAVVRRLRPFTGSAVALDGAAAVLPALAVLTLAAATDRPTALLAAAALVLLATVVTRRDLLRRGADDDFWRTWWLAALPIVALAAAVVTGETLVVGTAAAQVWVLVAFAMLAGAAGWGPLVPAVRVAALSGLLAWIWLLGCHVAHAPGVVRGAGLAVAGLALVMVAHRSSAGHAAALGLAGHALGLVAMPTSVPGWSLVTTMALGTVGLVVTAAADERDSSPVGAALARAWRPLRLLPWSFAAAGVPIVLALAMHTAGVVPLDGPWGAAVLALAAVGYATLVRIGLPPRADGVLPWASFVAGVLASLTSGSGWPQIVGLAALVWGVVLLPSRRRAASMRWTAWTVLFPLAGLVAHRTVPWFAALPEHVAVVVTAVTVGAVLLVTAAAVDLRGRAWVPRHRPHRDAAVPPVVVGGAGVVVGLLLVPGLPRVTASVLVLVIAAVALAVGVLMRAGVLGGVSAVLAWSGVLGLMGARLDDEPWVAVVVTAALLLVAQGLSAVVVDRRGWVRWDVPLLLAAAPVALSALGLSADGPGRAVTVSLVGGLTCAVSVRLRARRTLAEVLGWCGTALILLAAVDAGAGWSALALLTLAAVHTGLAVAVSRREPTAAGWRDRGTELRFRQVTGAAAAVAAWSAAQDWLGWAPQTSVDATAVVAGAVTLAAGLVARSGRVARSWVVVFGGAAVLVAVTAVVTSAWPGGTWTGYAATMPSLWVVLGSLLVTSALAVAAAPLLLTWLRDVVAAGVLTTLLLALHVLGSSPAAYVGVLAVVSVAMAAASLALGSVRPEDPWSRPAAVLGLAAAAAAVLTGLVPQPDPLLLAPAVAVVAVQAAALGVALRSAALQMASPALACLAWVVGVAAPRDAGPQWYTVAVGLALIAVVTVWRRDRRIHGLDLAPAEVVAVELVAVAFLVVASLVQAVTTAPGHAVGAIVLGSLVAGWGLLTRVRRRVAAGAVVVLVAVAVLVVVPLVRLLPAWGGAGLWLLVAGVGLLAVLVATMLERGRNAVHGAVGRLRASTAGWE